jgi:hypothetical protein
LYIVEELIEDGTVEPYSATYFAPHFFPDGIILKQKSRVAV